jgi:hypothetical protein
MAKARLIALNEVMVITHNDLCSRHVDRQKRIYIFLDHSANEREEQPQSIALQRHFDDIRCHLLRVGEAKAGAFNGADSDFLFKISIDRAPALFNFVKRTVEEGLAVGVL